MSFAGGTLWTTLIDTLRDTHPLRLLMAVGGIIVAVRAVRQSRVTDGVPHREQVARRWRARGVWVAVAGLLTLGSGIVVPNRYMDWSVYAGLTLGVAGCAVYGLASIALGWFEGSDRARASE